MKKMKKLNLTKSEQNEFGDIYYLFPNLFSTSNEKTKFKIVLTNYISDDFCDKNKELTLDLAYATYQVVEIVVENFYDKKAILEYPDDEERLNEILNLCKHEFKLLPNSKDMLATLNSTIKVLKQLEPRTGLHIK